MSSSITVQKLKKVEPAVIKCLQQIPAARDNDTLLILKIWAAENPALRDPLYPFVNFAAQLLDDQYTKADTITRCRRKIQELYPELRGDKWQDRHNEAENTRKEIKEN